MFREIKHFKFMICEYGRTLNLEVHLNFGWFHRAMKSSRYQKRRSWTIALTRTAPLIVSPPETVHGMGRFLDMVKCCAFACHATKFQATFIDALIATYRKDSNPHT
ncbi:hypothetical protein EVAR_7195_1 [Eumeta japonica]|uniref:Uncharacterized protein n=1 Tax=Eumeta variegata TaxID=151549 RepID=A0A4C1T309_EUMVA|nr:hypothetical protein EVAR_7195_1 [Eumeta japonica]